MNRAWRLRTTLVALPLVAAGCGYGLVGRTSSLPEDIEAIFISPLSNRTLRQQVDQTLTEAINDEFLRRPKFELVNSPLEADAVLSGSLTAFRVKPVLFGAEEGRASEYEIEIVAAMEFKRVGTEEVIWEQPYYQFREQYEFDEAELIDFEETAILDVAQDFAQTLVIDILEGF